MFGINNVNNSTIGSGYLHSGESPTGVDDYRYYSFVIGSTSTIRTNNTVMIGSFNYAETGACSSTFVGSYCYSDIRGEHCISTRRPYYENSDKHERTQQRSTFIVGVIDNDTGNPPSKKYLTTLGRYAGTGDHPAVNLRMPNEDEVVVSGTGSLHATWAFDCSMSIIDVTSGNHGSYNVKGAVGSYGTATQSGYVRIIGTGEPERYMEGALTGIQVFVEPHTGTHSLMFSVIGISGLETRYSASVEVKYSTDFT